MDFRDFDTRVAVYGVATRQTAHGTELLLALWNGASQPGGAWTMPGGGADWGEDLEDALCREFREETGLEVRVDGLLGVTQGFFQVNDLLPGEQRPRRALRIAYDVTPVGGTLGTTEIGGSTDEARWWPLDQIPDLRHVALVDSVLEMIRDRAH